MTKVLMVEFNPWDYRLQVGGHKYARGFQKANWEVFWLTTFLNVNRFIRRREDDRYFINGWRRGVIKPDSNIFTYTPFSLLPYINMPFLRSRSVAENTLRFTYPSLTNTLLQYNFQSPDVLWMTNPRCYSLLKIVQPKLLVYRMADDVGAFPAEPNLSIQLEEKICRQADIIFATARKLVEKAQQWSDNVHYLPNGVDYDFFTTSTVTIPADIANLPHPRIIYVGAIDTWFDFSTLTSVAQQMPNFSFIIIGPVSGGEQVKDNLKQLSSLPNVYVLGSRPFEQVRNYMRSADIGIIPFIPNQLTHSISPIKLFEYLASGLTVVASNLQEIKYIASPAMVYETTDEFVHLLKSASETCGQNKEISIRFAQKNSWQKRFDYAHEQIRQQLHINFSNGNYDVE